MKEFDPFELGDNENDEKKLEELEDFEVPIICKGCGKTCEWDDDGFCYDCGKLEYGEEK